MKNKMKEGKLGPQESCNADTTYECNCLKYGVNIFNRFHIVVISFRTFREQSLKIKY